MPANSTIAPTKVKNVIFDFGGVILNLDHSRATAEFAKLGIPNLFAHYSTLRQDNYFDRFEEGLITAEEFERRICTDFGLNIPSESLVKAWNALLLDIPQQRIDFLEKLKPHYRTFLLSNTNEIHVAAFHALMQREYSKPDLSHLFEKVYYSCRMGLRKPSVEIFNRLLADSKLKAGQTVFIDDLKANVEAAEKIGIGGVHLKPGEEIAAVLNCLLPSAETV